MALPTHASDQITDAVCVAPAQALGILAVSLSQSLALAAATAVTQQRNANIRMNAVSARAVARLLGAEK